MDGLDWRQPYRSMDAAGSPEAAENVGWRWIEDLAVQQRSAAGDPAGITIESPSLGSDGRAIALYSGTRLIALASIFRDPMNFAVLVRWRADAAAPIPMVLHCPECGLQHVDEAVAERDEDGRQIGWTNPPHRSHLCHGCGCIWRPCDVATEGVSAIATAGTADTWPVSALIDRRSIRALARQAALEQAAGIAENFTREGRDWVPDSLWDNITKGLAAAIRSKGAGQ